MNFGRCDFTPTLALPLREREQDALTLTLSRRERGLLDALTLALPRWERGLREGGSE